MDSLLPLAYCFDLDGTLYRGDVAIPGAVAAIARLRERGIPFRCLSNTSSRSRAGLAERLRRYGFDITEHELTTAVVAAAALIRSRGHRRVLPLVSAEASADLAGLELAGGTSERPSSPVDAVLIGDLGDAWRDRHMQEAFQQLRSGADFIAVSRDRYWLRGETCVLDCGAYVAGLEYVTGRSAEVAGKPTEAFYRSALAAFEGIPAERVAMVGDDPWSDVAGAQRAGLMGWFVESGKADRNVLAEAGVSPDRILPSIADLPL
ncbi:MAG TPA: HAD-IIA family hydrolase [Gemmatimonadales bacterium]|nr:HAD-IIA family hydrolase [Gemmatimonadales bacterium]